MAGASLEEITDWATPSDREFLAHAYSEESLLHVTSKVTELRQQFLIESLRSEALVRSGVVLDATVSAEPQQSVPNISFEDIPLKLTLSRDEHRQLAPSCDASTHRNTADLKSYWIKLASVQSELSGFRVFATKYDDCFYNDTAGHWADQRRKICKQAYERSKYISDSGYPVRFLMDGAQYIQSSSIDLATVERWVEMRESMPDPIAYRNPRDFWPQMIEAKRQSDEHNRLGSYADVVRELAPGVYVAPYIAEEVIGSAQFVNYDDVWRATKISVIAQTMATRAFRKYVEIAVDGPEKINIVRDQYFRTPVQLKSGIVFISLEALGRVIDKLDSDNLPFNEKLLTIAEQLYLDRTEEDDYSDLVFGTN